MLSLRSFGFLSWAVSIASLTLPASAASLDGNVEWAGISHLEFQDRRPLCPLGQEAFEVRIRTWRGDVEQVLVQHDADGTGPVAAAVIGQLGPYDLWAATLPPAAGPQVHYFFELTDGADTDAYGPGGMQDLSPALVDGFLVDFATLSHAPFGATPHPAGGVVFRVWAAGATTAFVRGQFNSWGLSDPMSPLGEDFVAFVPSATINQRYKYYFDDSVWNTDPRGRSIDGGDNYNALVQDPLLFPWTDDGWSPPPLEEMVIYQLHVGTFAGRNDPFGSTLFPSRYVDVSNRASHLADLGVNVVMLTPITEFPGDVSAGYNPISAWAPERWYGAPNDLKRMVDALHAAGIAVILDIVWNHLSFTDNFLWNYDGTQIYFDNPPVDTPWGAQADFDRPAVSDMYADSAHMWLDEYHFDGFRMDATSFMNVGNNGASGWALMQRLNDEIDNRWADRVVIAEQLPDDSVYTLPTAFGGAGFDAQYFDAFTDNLRQELIDAAFGDPEMWKIRDVVQGFGPELSGARVVNYLELHDEAWPESGGQRFVRTIDPNFPHDDVYARGRSMLGQGMVLFSPGVPAMLMGTEWLEDTDFGTDINSRIDWSKKTTYAEVFSYYRDAIALRRSLPELRADAFVEVSHLNESANVIGMRRGTGTRAVYVLANFSNTDYPSYRIGVPLDGDWEVLLDSQDAAYGGAGALNDSTVTTQALTRDGFAQSLDVGLRAMGLLVLRHADAATATLPGPTGPTRLWLAPALPNPSRGQALVRFSLPRPGRVELALFDLRGRRVRTLLRGFRDAGEQEWVVSTRGLARGSYLLRLRTPAGVRTEKLLLLD